MSSTFVEQSYLQALAEYWNEYKDGEGYQLGEFGPNNWTAADVEVAISEYTDYTVQEHLEVWGSRQPAIAEKLFAQDGFENNYLEGLAKYYNDIGYEYESKAVAVAAGEWNADNVQEAISDVFGDITLVDHFVMYGNNTKILNSVDEVVASEAGDTFTLTETVDEPAVTEEVLYWGYTPNEEREGGSQNDSDASQGIPAEELISFLKDINIDLVELGVIDDDGVDPNDVIESITIGDVSNTGNNAQIDITLLDGTSLSAEASLGEDYLNFLSNLIFDEDGNSRLFMKEVVVEEGQEADPIVLTPTENNAAMNENGDIAGNPTDADNTIVAGRTELLHEAFINAGGGYDTLEVDAKGVFAQPTQLLNIEEIQVQNLPNVYSDNEQTDSIIDISRATSLEKLVVSEGNFSSYDDVDLGSLTIAGVRNNADLRLEGNFSEDVTVHYGQGLEDAIDVELRLGDVESDINILHNQSVINVDSQGIENHMHEFFAGGDISKMYISGEAEFAVEEDLSDGFNSDRPAVIDASENTGGVDLLIEGQPEVQFVGTETDDRFDVDGSAKIDVDAGAGDDAIYAYHDDYYWGMNPSVDIDAGEGDNLVALESDVENEFGNLTLNISAGSGDDRMYVDYQANLSIDAGDGNNQVYVVDDGVNGGFDQQVSIVTGAGDDKVLLASSFFSQGQNIGTEEAIYDVNTGAGQDTVILGGPVDYYGYTNADGIVALNGSSFTGDEIDLQVERYSDLSRADLSEANINSVTLSRDLTLTAEQFSDIGADKFVADRASFDHVQGLNLVVTEDVTLSDLVNLEDLDSSVRLSFDIREGAELTLSAEELHKYVFPEGIDSTDGLNGKVTITDAGLTFDAFDNGNEYKVYPGGSLTGNFDASDDVTIIRDAEGFNRPEPEDSTDTWTIDATGGAIVLSDADVEDGDNEDGVITVNVKTMEITGDQDVVFEDPVDLADNFTIDFSELDGDLTLTVANFQDMTEASDVQDQGEIIGNGTEGDPVRLNIELADGAVVGSQGNENGFKSQGVQEYVVTDIYDGDESSMDAAAVYVCDNTEGVQTLGLQGNYDKSIFFLQMNWNTELLLEGDGSAGYPDKASGNPNYSNIGTLAADYFWEGASAVVNLNNQGTELEDRDLRAEGIHIADAKTITVNVEDGDAVIGAINSDEYMSALSEDGVDQVENLVFNSANDVTVQGNLDIGDDGSGLAVLDASGVDGTFTLELTDDATTDLSDTEVSGLDAVVFATHEAELTLSADDVMEIVDSADFSYTGDPDEEATLNVTGLSDDLFAPQSDLPEGINLGTVTVAEDQDVVLHEDTDLTGIDELVVGEDSSLTLTAEQFLQLDGAPINGDGDVTITDLTDEQATELDLSTVAAAGELTLLLADDSVTFGDRDADLNADLGSFAIELAEGQSISFTDPEQAHERVIEGAADTQVTFLFTYNNVDTTVESDNYDNLGQDIEDALDLSGYSNISDLSVWNILVEGQNVEEVLFGLDDFSVVNIIETPADEIDTTHRVVVVEPGVAVGTNGDGDSLIFEDLRDDWDVETLDLTLEGGSEIEGTVDLSGDQNGIVEGFKTLTINSEGDEANLMGDIQATDNNLLDVNINAQQDLEIGTINFNNQDDVDEGIVASLDVSTEDNATVTIDGLDTENADQDIHELAINLEGNGTLDLGDIDITGLDKLDINLGTDATMMLSENLDLTDIGEVNIEQTQDIVLGEGVELTLTAAQAHELNIVADPDLDPNDPSVTMPVVNIEDLGEAQYDLSGISADVAGQATLASDIVELDEGTDLGDFSIYLTDGQVIGFGSVPQADGRVVDVADGEGASIAWLFDSIVDKPLDASGYDGVSASDEGIIRLYINDVLVQNDPDVEGNWEDLSQFIETINIQYTGDLETSIETQGFNRTFEVQGFTELNSGADVIDDDDVWFVENLTFDLGGEVEIGDISVDNIIGPEIDGDDPFGTLTINSMLFDTDEAHGPDNPLAPQDWDPDNVELVDPVAINTVGDISSGTERNDLTDVVLNAQDAALDVGTITFATDEAGSTVYLTVPDTSTMDITVDVAATTEPNIDTLDITNDGSGTLTVTGASAALQVDDTETVDLNGSGDMVFGTFDDPATAEDESLASLTSNTLSELDAGGLSGDLTMSFINSVDSGDFTFTSGSGVTSVTLGGEMVLNAGDITDPDSDYEGWTFDLSNAAGDSELILTGDVDFSNAGALALDMGEYAVLEIQGDVDLTNLADLTLDWDDDRAVVNVQADSSLTLFAGLADGLGIGGAGTVIIPDLEEFQGADLSGIMTDADDTGSVEAALDSGEAGDTVDLFGDLGVAEVTISGEGTVSISGDVNDASFTVGADATLELTAAQADGRVVDGEGTVTVTEGWDTAPEDLDLSGLTADTVNLELNDDVTLNADADLGDNPITVPAGFTLTAPGTVLSGVTVQGEGAVVVTDDATGADLSGLAVESIALDPAADVDGDTVWPELADGQTLTLIAVKADGLEINGETGSTISVGDLGEEEVDLSGLAADTMTASVDSPDITLHENTDLGDVDVGINGNKLTLSGAQADGTTITGDGSGTVVVTDIESGHDLSGIDVDSLTLQAADGVEELTITAAQADGASVEGTDLTDLIVTDLEDALNADLSTLDAGTGADEYAVEVQLDASDNPEIGAEADLSGINSTNNSAVYITGDGVVTVADGAVVDDTSFDIGNGSTLVADLNLTGDSAINTGEVEGYGTLQYEAIAGASITADETVRYTEFNFDEGMAQSEDPVTITDFEPEFFAYQQDAESDEVIGRHKLDFTDIFDVSDYEDVSSVFTAADQSGTNDILSFSVASTTANSATDVAGEFQDTGDYTDGSTTADFGEGAEKIFITSNDTDSDIWYWADGTGSGAVTDGEVQDVELTQLGDLDEIQLTGLADLEDGNFVFAA